VPCARSAEFVLELPGTFYFCTLTVSRRVMSPASKPGVYCKSPDTVQYIFMNVRNTVYTTDRVFESATENEELSWYHLTNIESPIYLGVAFEVVAGAELGTWAAAAASASSSFPSTASLMSEIVLSKLRLLVLGLVMVVPRLACRP